MFMLVSCAHSNTLYSSYPHTFLHTHTIFLPLSLSFFSSLSPILSLFIFFCKRYVQYPFHCPSHSHNLSLTPILSLSSLSPTKSHFPYLLFFSPKPWAVMGYVNRPISMLFFISLLLPCISLSFTSSPSFYFTPSLPHNLSLAFPYSSSLFFK